MSKPLKIRFPFAWILQRLILSVEILFYAGVFFWVWPLESLSVSLTFSETISVGFYTSLLALFLKNIADFYDFQWKWQAQLSFSAVIEAFQKILGLVLPLLFFSVASGLFIIPKAFAITTTLIGLVYAIIRLQNLFSLIGFRWRFG